METTKKQKQGFKGIEAAGLVIIACFIVALCIYKFVLGDPSNFMNNDPNNHPLPGNMLGTIYKGGVVVPVIQTLLLTVLALSVERYFTIRAAFGRGKLVKFVAQIKDALAKNDMEAAQALCDKQRGSVANVVGATLQTYREMDTVIGMIRSFAALSAGGGTDSVALSTGISEALINTAFGILTGALAVISYNYFTNKIDKLTYSLDEVGFSIVQTFNATHK